MEAIDGDVVRTALTRWLARRMPAASNLAVSPISRPKGGGFSAETCLFDIAYDEGGEAKSRSLVLRRLLEGDELFFDTSLDAPWRAMEAMAKHTDIPVPSTFGIETDRSVLGSPFFVMGRVEGRIVPQFPNYNVEGWVSELSPADRARLWRNGIEVMAKIHAVDWQCGFQFLDRPERGVTGLGQYINGIVEWHRWAGAGRIQPTQDAAVDYLLRHSPKDMLKGVVWGDSIPANILFAGDLTVAAVIDWEAAALGPGEIDLAWWLVFDDLFSTDFGVPRLSGLPTRQQTIDTYETAAHRTVTDIDYFEILALLRLAIITTRGVDRQIRAGSIRANSVAYLNNPTTARLAAKLGLPVPEVGEDYLALVRASTQQQI